MTGRNQTKQKQKQVNVAPDCKESPENARKEKTDSGYDNNDAKPRTETSYKNKQDILKVEFPAWIPQAETLQQHIFRYQQIFDKKRRKQL